MACRTLVSAVTTSLVVAGVAGFLGRQAVLTQASDATYTVVDIGTLGGAATARGAGVDLFDIVGSAQTAAGTTVPFTRSFFTGMHALPTLGGANGDAYAVSGGTIVGRSQLANGKYHATLWQGGARDLGTLGGAQSIAYAVNGWGVVVGTADTLEAGATQAFAYDAFGNGVMTPLNVNFGGTRSIAYGINDAGRVVGTAGLAGNAVSHAFLYANGSATDLGSPGGTSVALSINRLDHVAGYWQSANGAATRAFVYADGSFRTLPTLGGAVARAIAIADDDTMVGDADTAAGVRHAVMWRNGAIVDLNTLIPAGSGWVLQAAVAFGGGGIVGYGLHGGQRRGFALLPPVDVHIRITGVRDEDTNIPKPVEAGRSITLGAEAMTDTTSWVTGVVITDTIAGPIEYESWQSDQMDCTQSGQTLTCRARAPIDPGSSGPGVLIRARTTAAGAITHRATVSADQADPNPADNTDSQSNTAISLADLAVASPVVGGRSALARATVTSPVGSAGARVRLSSSNPAVASVPSAFDVLSWSGGGLWREFYVTTTPVSAVTDVQISATYGLKTVTRTLRILPFAPTPWGGRPQPVPGQIEAEDYDVGGEGIAYHDTTQGNAGGVYRTNSVDIAPAQDAGGGYTVGWAVAGEWLNYTVDVGTAGDYVVQARVASRGAGGRFHVEAKGGNTSGPVAVPDTGGWQSWRTVSAPLPLAAGAQSLTIVFDANGPTGSVGNLNWFRVVRAGSASTPYGGSPRALPGTVEAEQFDAGGEAVAYHDTTTGNLGGDYRATQVDIQATTDTGGGYLVGWTKAGEWLNYTVTVPAAGAYTLSARVASKGAGGTFHVEFGGVDRTGPIAVPSTGGWQTFLDLTRGVNLAAGTQIMRVVFDANGATGGIANINSVTIASGAPATR